MKIRLRLQAVLLAAIVLIAGSAHGQRFYQMQAHGTLIEVLSPEVFEATFGDNPLIPRTERAIIALAEKLYPPLMLKIATGAQTGGNRRRSAAKNDMGDSFRRP